VRNGRHAATLSRSIGAEILAATESSGLPRTRHTESRQHFPYPLDRHSELPLHKLSGQAHDAPPSPRERPVPPRIRTTRTAGAAKSATYRPIRYCLRKTTPSFRPERAWCHKSASECVGVCLMPEAWASMTER
jgi:hypothetical protein